MRGKDLLVWISIIIMIGVSGSLLIHHEQNYRVETLESSHAYMEQRVKILKNITCGYCHDAPIEWCDKHGEAGE
jgi:hypothetical protein